MCNIRVKIWQPNHAADFLELDAVFLVKTLIRLWLTRRFHQGSNHPDNVSG
jgi:hypothetical protein